MTPICPFAKSAPPDDASFKKPEKHAAGDVEGKPRKDSAESAANAAVVTSSKCPFGYDSHSFKLGPLSCLLCQALLFNSSKCVPCSHVYCKACISRFKDCPLCGADIEKVEPDTALQAVVDRFIEGHARIKRSHVNTDEEKEADENKKVIYEDVSLERGAFLVQQAMRAFRGQNLESAKLRLSICAEDIRCQIERTGHTSDLCSQLGAVLGMLGDCCRAMGDAGSAITCFEESIEFLNKVPGNDLEITHTLSVSLNKVGDLKYYDGDLEAARSYYFRSLNVRRDAMAHHPNVPSQTLDVAVSLAKVADADRNIGNVDAALDTFREAIQLLESLTLKPEEAGLEQRRHSVLEFLKSQIGDEKSDATP
uniref:RING-type domain-containing protein n=1 Tax=Rhizophora mucronata TaxID=61149 RepID=A0A2P2JFK2_RHIMU